MTNVVLGVLRSSGVKIIIVFLLIFFEELGKEEKW